MLIPSSFLMYAGEIRLYAINFNTQAEIIAGETIVSVNSLDVDRSGLTITTDAGQANPISFPGNPPTISGNKVYMWISGSIANYILTMKVTTNAGSVLKEKVRLAII